MTKKWFTFPEPGWYGRGLKDVLIYWDGKNWTESVRIVKDGVDRFATKTEAKPYINMDKEKSVKTSVSHGLPEVEVPDTEVESDAAIQSKVVVPVIVGASAFVAISTLILTWVSNRKQ
jgi:hypothetical protein